MTKIPVLTIKQPWLYAILRLNKRIENRSWKPPQKLIGTQIALHAAKTYSYEGFEFIEKKLKTDINSSNVHGNISAILGIATIKSYFTFNKNIPINSLLLSDEQLKWCVGPYCWILDDVHELETPVYNISGRQRIWYYDKASIIPRKSR